MWVEMERANQKGKKIGFPTIVLEGKKGKKIGFQTIVLEGKKERMILFSFFFLFHFMTISLKP